MPEENATPEVPATEPVVEAPAVEVPAAEPVVEVPAVEVPNAAAPVSVVESAPVPLTPVQNIEALSTEVLATLHDVFQYIHEGFDQHSLMIGMSRLYEIARAVKARLEA